MEIDTDGISQFLMEDLTSDTFSEASEQTGESLVSTAGQILLIYLCLDL